MAEWSRHLDIDNLQETNSWATLAELQTVVPFHLARYNDILTLCKTGKLNIVTSKSLTFASRFLAVYLFIQVKGSRPMTYHYLTISMFEKSKGCGGFIDQKEFKTSLQYTFDSVLLDAGSTETMDDYIRYVRPLLHPKCDYLLVTRSGIQYKGLTDLMSILTFQAIGKYIFPTRYRQIVETESALRLSSEELSLVRRDQKHSSQVARTHYQKLASRDVAVKARHCGDKLKDESALETLRQSFSSQETTSKRPRHQLGQNHSMCNQRTMTLRSMSKNELSLTQSNISEGHLSQRVTPIRKRHEPFSFEEDDYLKEGIVKHGYGKRTAIRRDPNLNFHNSRTCDSLIEKRKDSQISTMKFIFISFLRTALKAKSILSLEHNFLIII